MRTYLFTSRVLPPLLSKDQIQRTLHHIMQGTDVSELVTALYFNAVPAQSRGCAYVDRWRNPQDFTSTRGYWKLTGCYPRPSDLPDRFKLIRIHIGGDLGRYPREERDIYGWKFRYNSVLDHIAFLFAHELHHFRRYHLGFHHREGEQSANRWAIGVLSELGYPISGVQDPSYHRKKNKRRDRRIWIPKRHAPLFDLEPGSRIFIDHDPRHHYTGESAKLIRKPRKNSKRLVIETSDGRQWRWPMDWIKHIEESAIDSK